MILQNKNITLVCILLISMLSGCAQQIRPAIRSHLGTERIFQKNYEIGQKMAAYVGQPVVKVKDYKVDRFRSKHMRASNDFVVTGGIVTITGDKKTDYPVRGEIELNEQSYTVLNVPGSQLGAGFGLLIGEDGTVHDKVLNNNIISACPKSPLFVISTKGRNLECQYYQRDKISRYARNDSLTDFSDRH